MKFFRISGGGPPEKMIISPRELTGDDFNILIFGDGDEADLYHTSEGLVIKLGNRIDLRKRCLVFNPDTNSQDVLYTPPPELEVDPYGLPYGTPPIDAFLAILRPGDCVWSEDRQEFMHWTGEIWLGSETAEPSAIDQIRIWLVQNNFARLL